MQNQKKSVSRERIEASLNKIVELFQSGNVPEAIRISCFPRYQVPSNKWSLLNRIIMFINDTGDARGLKQWSFSGRKVAKGSKAFYILAPKTIKKQLSDSEEEKVMVTGFIPVAVFRVEDTLGADLEYSPIELPPFPLMDIAQKWGLDVRGLPLQGGSLGYYTSGKIRLASPEETVFFHELSHHAHERVIGRLKTGQNPFQEAVAELSAQVIADLVGTSINSTQGNAYSYIEFYAQKMNKNVPQACISVLNDVQRVLHEIFEIS